MMLIIYPLLRPSLLWMKSRHLRPSSNHYHMTSIIAVGGRSQEEEEEKEANEGPHSPYTVNRTATEGTAIRAPAMS
jgi:hypothetical protein